MASTQIGVHQQGHEQACVADLGAARHNEKIVAPGGAKWVGWIEDQRPGSLYCTGHNKHVALQHAYAYACRRTIDSSIAEIK